MLLRLMNLLGPHLSNGSRRDTVQDRELWRVLVLLLGLMRLLGLLRTRPSEPCGILDLISRMSTSDMIVVGYLRVEPSSTKIVGVFTWLCAVENVVALKLMLVEFFDLLSLELAEGTLEVHFGRGILRLGLSLLLDILRLRILGLALVELLHTLIVLAYFY